jgi:hypothetical protein
MRDGAPRSEVGRVRAEIDTIREELGGLVHELDRRRHEAFDLGLQIRKHPLLVAAVATTAALFIGGAIAVAHRARRVQRRPTVRARETRRALARLFEHPKRVAADPSIAIKIGTAVGVALATAVTKRLVDRAVKAR